MSLYKFTPTQRYAIYTVWDEKCYLCNKPIDLKTMDVDHIIPENMLRRPSELAEIFESYGLPKDFDLQSYHNWAAACSLCNNRKSGMVFSKSLIVQVELQRAAKSSARAASLAEQVLSNQTITKALNAIERFNLANKATTEVQFAMDVLARFHKSVREPNISEENIRIVPLVEVISKSNGIQIVKGPYGVGGGPTEIPLYGGAVCPGCGWAAWNGARCVVCGLMDDD